MIAGEQVKVARKLLGWTQEKLASAARVSKTSVLVCEGGELHQSDWVIDAIQDALETAGVEFPEGEPPRLNHEP